MIDSAKAETGSIWRHKKRGSVYRVIDGFARAQAPEGAGLIDYEMVVVYQSGDGETWVRRHSEFLDGRFEKLSESSTEEWLTRMAAAKTGHEVSAGAVPPLAGAELFQARVKLWMDACFGLEISADRIERNHRFIEEALELVQANGCTRSEAHQLVDYVYDRPIGDLQQEIGGVMVTLAALCLASKQDMHKAGEIELARVWTKIVQIRAKQAAKPKHSPLPQSVDSPTARADVAQPEIDRLRKERDDLSVELSIWKSVFPDIVPRNVLPDRSKLEYELDRLRAENVELSHREKVRSEAINRALTCQRELAEEARSVADLANKLFDQREEYLSGLNARNAELSAENARMRSALEPFASRAGRYDPVDNDDGEPDWSTAAPSIRIGDLRRARAALEKSNG